MRGVVLALGLVAVAACGAWLWYRDAVAADALERLARAADAGVRLAKQRVADRREATQVAAVAHRAAIAQSDRAIAHFSQTAEAMQAAPAVELPGHLTLVGVPIAPLDTVVTLGQYRVMVEAAQRAVDSLVAERAVARVRLQVTDSLVAALDTALVRTDEAVAAQRALVAAQQCRILGVPCPSRLASAALGVAGAILIVVLHF